MEKKLEELLKEHVEQNKNLTTAQSTLAVPVLAMCEAVLNGDITREDLADQVLRAYKDFIRNHTLASNESDKVENQMQHIQYMACIRRDLAFQVYVHCNGETLMQGILALIMGSSSPLELLSDINKEVLMRIVASEAKETIVEGMTEQ